MGERGCNRDDCPPAHTQVDSTTNCGKCNALVHLMCIGINHKTKVVLFHPNVKVFCNKCQKGEFESPKSIVMPSTFNRPINAKPSSNSQNIKASPAARQTSMVEYSS